MRRVSEALFSHRAPLVALVILLGTSCATHKDSLTLRQELATLQLATDARLSMIERTVSTLDSLVREQNQLTMGLRASIGIQTQDQEDRMAMIAARQDEINYQLRDLLENLEAIQLYGGISTPAQSTTTSSQQTILNTQHQPSMPPSITPSGSTATTSVPPAITTDAEALFRSAIEDIDRQNYALAESRLLTFMIQFPDHELSGNAQYWLGEAAYGQRRYDIAIQEFDKLLKKYQNSPKVPAALLKKGLAQIQIGEQSDGQQTLRQLVRSFPDSPEAAEAGTMLETM